MKKITVAIALTAIVTLACKKKKDEYCYYEAMKGNSSIYVWVVHRPTNDQIQKVQDTCRCTVTIRESCVPCTGIVTDAGGNAIACD